MNYYKVLGIEENATKEEIKKAYDKQVQTFREEVKDEKRLEKFLDLFKEAYDALNYQENIVQEQQEEIFDEEVSALFKNNKIKEKPADVLQDKEGRYWGVIWRKSIYLIGMYGYGRYSVKSTELLDYCKKADKVVTIDVSGVYNYNMKNERIAARKDMVMYSEQYNEKVARDNVNRYKTILAKRRSLGNINFDDIDDQVQDVVAKVLMVSRMVHKNPAKYADSSYKISYLNNWVYDQERYDKGKTYGKDGLLKLYDSLTNCFLNIQKEKDDRITRYYVKQIDSIKTQITDIINIIKSDLKYFGL